jgi:Lipase (class 3)
MLAAARGVMSLAEEIIAQELEINPDYSVVLVGHSLGGSVAAVLGQMWADTFRGIRVYAYGPACVAPMDDISRKIVVSVLLEGDPFSSLSLGHVADTSLALSHLCEDEDLRTNILVVTDGPLETMDKDDLMWCKEQMEEIREQMTGSKLYPPGRLLFLGASENKKGSSVIREVPSTFYGELRIGTRMFDLRRHVPRVYQRRLKSALRSFEKPHQASRH